MTTHYKQTKDHPNWSLETPRQSRITGTWAHERQIANDIPAVAWVVGIAALAALFLAAYL